MSRLKRNEWNFASNAAQQMTKLLAAPPLDESELGRAEAELSEYRGLKRLDLAVFKRGDVDVPLVTGELKVPWKAEGRTPYNADLVRDAHSKASVCGAPYFVTWNIRRAVVWKTDDPGTPLHQRNIFDQEIIPVVLTCPEDLGKPEFQAAWRPGIEHLLSYLNALFTGEETPSYTPLDKQFIGKLESLLDFPIAFAHTSLIEATSTNRRFLRKVESWMRDRQGWTVSKATLVENLERAARFTCYVLVNRLCFYSALRRKYSALPELKLPKTIKTGEKLYEHFQKLFAKARNFTGDYDTVFEVDAGDAFPLLSDQAVPEWRTLVSSLAEYDFTSIDLEVIGAMYERLISPEERHRYGQHYTSPAVVDLINSFSINSGDSVVMDPACGGGTFLVRSYARKRQLDASQDHATLLASLYGCDLLRYACHLTVINLAVRDLIDDDNYPRVHCGDYLDVTPRTIFADLPIRLASGGLAAGRRQLRLSEQSCHAIVGNPPYIQSKVIPEAVRQRYVDATKAAWPSYGWNKSSDILVWFFTHSHAFLAPGGYLSLITQASWLDVEYGIPLQKWLLDHFQVVALIETEAEPWFSDARVATVVVVLKREDDRSARESHLVRCVQFHERLTASVPDASEANRQAAADAVRNAILAVTADVDTSLCRIRVIEQAELEAGGLNESGEYIGSKWGRFIRAIDCLYRVQKQFPESFCALRELATIKRGVTTNCDDFFLVEDISGDALARHAKPAEFESEYGVKRRNVSSGQMRIVRRSDGTEFPLESQYLRLVLRTARDVSARSTSRVHLGSCAVCLPPDRAKLSACAARYVASGERERWHETPSLQGRESWFVLRDVSAAPILFVKTIQYVPQVLWNDAGVVGNQRLYDIAPKAGVDAELICAVLASTLFAAERFSAVKAMGREAANDVEVFTAEQFKVFDVRQLSDAQQAAMKTAFRDLNTTDVQTLLEHVLEEAGQKEAAVYAAQHPVSPTVWPAELRNQHRRKIDELLYEALGFPSPTASSEVDTLYNEIVQFTRKAKLLELEAQTNRRGQGGGTVTPSVLADDAWADLTANHGIEPKIIPADFLPVNATTETVSIPAGPVEVETRDLFSEGDVYALRFGRGKRAEYRSAEQRDLVMCIAECGVLGDTAVPSDASVCRQVRDAIVAYMDASKPLMTEVITAMTDNPDLQQKILKEAMKRLCG